MMRNALLLTSSRPFPRQDRSTLNKNSSTCKHTPVHTRIHALCPLTPSLHARVHAMRVAAGHTLTASLTNWLGLASASSHVILLSLMLPVVTPYTRPTKVGWGWLPSESPSWTQLTAARERQYKVENMQQWQCTNVATTTSTTQPTTHEGADSDSAPAMTRRVQHSTRFAKVQAASHTPVPPTGGYTRVRYLKLHTHHLQQGLPRGRRLFANQQHVRLLLPLLPQLGHDGVIRILPPIHNAQGSMREDRTAYTTPSPTATTGFGDS